MSIYAVYRANALVASVAGLTYSDQGLAPESTHVYAVRAIDAAGNPSGLSATKSASTDGGRWRRTHRATQLGSLRDLTGRPG